MSTAMPRGVLKRATVGKPSALPMFGRPASVVTTAAGVILRIALLPASATKRLPDTSSATPVGLLKRAAEPVPLAEPAIGASPATVVTAAPDVIFRIVWLS